MRRVLAPLAVLALAAPTRAADEGPRIVFPQKDFVFAKAIQGAEVRHAFAFKNEGTAELVIRKVETSCGCTVGKISRERVKPGESGTIELVLDTTEKLGAATLVRATVYTNDTTQQAVGPCTTLLELKGEVVTGYKLLPTGAWFGMLQRGREPTHREVRAPGVLHAAAGYEVTKVEVPVEWLKVEPRRLDPKELSGDSKGGWCFKVTVLPHLPAGEFQHWVVVRTNVPEQPWFRFPVVGLATGPIRGPEAVTFERVRRGQEPERVCPLERVDDRRGVNVVSVDYDRTRLTVQEEVAVEGVRVDLRVKVRKDCPPGPFAGSIIVRLDDPEIPLLRFPVFGDILPRVVVDPPVLLTSGEGHVVVTIDGGKLTGVKAVPEDAFEVAVKPPEGGRGATVTVKAKRPVAKGSLVLATDVPGEESVTVPVEVRK